MWMIVSNVLCVFDSLTKQEIQEVIEGNIFKLITNNKALELFKNYLEKEFPGTSTLDHLRVIEEDEEDELELLLHKDLYKKLAEAEEAEQKEKVLDDIRQKYAMKIDGSDEYKNFKEHLFQKYRSACPTKNKFK